MSPHAHEKIPHAERGRIFRELERVDPKFSDRIRPFLKGLYDHYFRCEVIGWEQVPKKKSLFVGNHNGILTFEVLMLFYAWRERFGWSRRALGLAHNIAVNNPAFRWILTRIGAIPGDPELAEEAFARDYSLMVYPGGEKEAFRPYRDRKKVEFFGRMGFIRLALKAGVPIVPIVSIGAQETYVILHRGEEIAEALGLKQKLRLHGFPITYRGIFFLWCLTSGVFTFFPLLITPAAFLAIFVPLPAKMTFRILEPIDPQALLDPALTDEENHAKIYQVVVDRMQKVLNDEYAKRKYPVVG